MAKQFETNAEPENTGKPVYKENNDDKQILASGVALSFTDSGENTRFQANATGFFMQKGKVLKTNVTYIDELLTVEDITEMKKFHNQYKWLLGDAENE